MSETGRKEIRSGSRPRDKRVTLAPLQFEEALEAILKTGPHPKDDEPAPNEDKKKAPPKGRRSGKASPPKS